MESIVLRTEYLKYEISELGENVSFSTPDGEDRILRTPTAVIVNCDGSEVRSVGASLSHGILTLRFADGTVSEIYVKETSSYITFTLKSITREDFLYISFINIDLKEPTGDFEAVMMGMTLHTRMAEHPGDNRKLIASAYPHIGLFSTARSKHPAKAALFCAPRALVRGIERDILDEIPDGEIPKSDLGGPYADLARDTAREDYFILMQDTATLENVDSIIEEMRRFGLTQITLHHNSHYRQGDFLPKADKFPNGVEDFKAVVDRFHENGIKVGLQTYCFFLSRSSSYVTPVPHKDLDVLRSFTLKGDISEEVTSLSVEEDTEGITAEEGFIYVNSPFLWIDDELIRFSVAENGVFTVAERGALGTRPASHKSGSPVKHLKQYFLLPLAKAGSELFYEVARKTAEFFDATGADCFYLDALDGAFVLDGEDYVWYHAMDFVKEMFAHLKHKIIFDCCYNPQYTGTWYVRSRYGAIDVSLNAHRACFDKHTEYNMKTAARMGITPELGWIDLFPREDDPEKMWLNQPLFPEDVEYVAAKAYATGASVSFLEGFRRHGKLPSAEQFSRILCDFSTFRKAHKPSDATVSYLLSDGAGATLRDGRLYAKKCYTATFEQGASVAKIRNDFNKQTPHFRLEALPAADSYDHPRAIPLVELDENRPIKGEMNIRLEKPVAACGNHGLGVYCKGDGSGALITVALRNLAKNSRKSAEHYIKADFVGWRYFAFYELQNATLDPSVKAPKKLEYITYNHLQEFYGYYRAKMDYETLDGVDITVEGSDAICLRTVKLVPHILPDIVNPTLHFGNTSIKILTRLRANENLYFDGESCVVRDGSGNELSRPEFVGTPTVPYGESLVTLEREEDLPTSRAKLTLITHGEELA